MKFLIIDNYDSFVYNIAQYLGELGVECDVFRNDKITISQIKENNYDGIIISPGPGTPEDKKYFGICSDVIKDIGPTTPILGVCLGHQGIIDAFQAVFPAGTVSGAPKVRAMQIIDELENEERGPYAGAVGYFSYNGCCDFAIAIRSIFIENNKGFVQSGAGIVSDSVAENEFKETEHKAGAMLQALKEASD